MRRTMATSMESEPTRSRRLNVLLTRTVLLGGDGIQKREPMAKGNWKSQHGLYVTH